MVATPPLFDESLADDVGTGWKVSYDSQFSPWLIAASTDDPRPVLTGVYVDPAGWLVATDGNALVVVPADIQPGILQTDPFAGAVIPASFLKAAHKAARRRKLEQVEVSIVGARARYEVTGGGTWANLINATFPDWRSLIPRSIAPAQADGLNPELAVKLCSAIGAWVFCLMSDGTKNSAFVVAGPDGTSFGLLMPVALDYEMNAEVLERARASRPVRE